MSRLRSSLVRIRNLFRRSATERDLNDELGSNLQMHVDDNIRSGMTPAEARRAALMKFGSIDSAKEAWRDRRGLPFIEIFFTDLRYACRSLSHNPGFALVAVITLALGIGANTAVFTIVNAVMIDQLPYREPDRLMVVWEITDRQPGKPNVVGPANFIRWTERSSVFERMAGFYEWRANLTGSGDPEQIVAQDVTANFFETLGVRPMIGRTFAPDEGTQGHNFFTVLSYGLWSRRFGSDPAIVGKTIQLNGRSVVVIGVMPADVGLFVKRGSLVGKPAELWTPFAFTEAMRRPVGRYMSAIARLKAGVSQSEAQAQMSGIADAMIEELPNNKGWGVKLIPVHEELSGEVRPALLMLTGAVAFVLLIACANVANLLLARGANRRREIAIRTAVGAGRARVFQQLLTESLLLAALGGIAGLLVARSSLSLLLSISPIDIARLGQVHLSYSVLAFTAAVSCVTAIICGFVPALETVRVDVQETLKDGPRQAGSGRRTRWVRQSFVVAELAIAVILLAGAGLMLRTFGNLWSIDPGFNYRNVLTFRTTLPRANYDNPEKILAFYQQAVQALASVPGVKAAGEISFLPLSGTGAATGFSIVGQPPPRPGNIPIVDVRIVDNGYFTVMSIPLVKGRLFTEREMRERTNVVVVNETMARQYFPGEEPIGKRLVIDMMDNPPATEVIGVVRDVKQADLTTAPRATAYWTHPMIVMSAMSFVVRTTGDPVELAPSAAKAIQSIDRQLPIAEVRTMENWIAGSLAQTRFSSTLLSGFGGLALILAAIGIYGVMSYSVAQRSSEIAVRLALGAQPRTIFKMIINHSLRLVAFGLAVGIPLALALTRTITKLLYETTASDPGVFALVVAMLSLVALIASYLPARRAARIMLVDALKHQ